MKTLQQIDVEIAQCEQQLKVLHEQRREWVNHLGLNKRVIRAKDFEYLWGFMVLCKHVPTGKSDSRAARDFQGDWDSPDTWVWAREHIVAELLAEGWAHAS